MGQNDIFDEKSMKRQMGENLVKLRDTMEWSQAKMASVMAVSSAALSNYIKAERMPNIEALLRIRSCPAVKRKGIFLTLDDFFSDTFDPQKAQHSISTTDTVEIDETHQDFVGVYLCYFYDQSLAYEERTSNGGRELRFGVLVVYDDYRCVTGEKRFKALAAFYKEKEAAEAVRVKRELDEVFKSGTNVSERNKAMVAIIEDVKKTAGVYEGGLSFSNQHVFFSFSSDVHHDNALMILYSPYKRADSDYLGGIGSIASVTHGRPHMPTAQKIIVSRYELKCSYEEITDYLNMSSAPVMQSEETVEITKLCKKLYGIDAPMGFLNDDDKEAIIEKRLEQLVGNYIKKSSCCVGSVSEDDDRRVYMLINKYSEQ